MEKFTKYEKARLIGSRALQIGLGAPILIDLSEDKLKEIRYNTMEIARMEFEQDKIPITVKRPLPHEKLQRQKKKTEEKKKEEKEE